MWYAIMAFLALFAALAVIYLTRRFHGFSPLKKLGERRRLLSWVLAFLPVAALGFLLCGLIGRILGRIRKKPVKYDLQGAAAILLTAAYLCLGWYNAHHVSVTRYAFETEKPIGSLRVVEIADFHLGITQFGDTFAREMERVNGYSPDAVVLVGDFVDDDSDVEDMIRACEALGRLNAPLGVYFVYGNHDDGYFHYRNFSSARLREELTKNGVTILEDEAVLADDRVYFVGRRDRSMPGRLTADALTAGLDPDKYTILLDHQPNDYAGEAGRADLVLSGHTHGGHIFPAGQIGLLAHANDRIYGTEVRDGTTFVVTSGISGWAIPFKTGTFSEFVVIDIEEIE